MTLGERIQQLRKTYGLSQEQLAEKVGVSRQAISKWETDQSLPEIEKILAISKAFSISTDELLGNEITASDSEFLSAQPEKSKTERANFSCDITRITNYINRKTIYMLFSMMCVIAVGVCVIVDVALNNNITWAWYPIISVVCGWLIATPGFFKKYALSLLTATMAVNPFLYLLNLITPVKDWYFKLGLPAALTGIAFAWIIYLMIRFLKINIWYKAAISVFLGGVAVSPVIDYFVNRFLQQEMSLLSLVTNIFSCVVTSAAFFIAGHIKNKKTVSEEVMAPG